MKPPTIPDNTTYDDRDNAQASPDQRRARNPRYRRLRDNATSTALTRATYAWLVGAAGDVVLRDAVQQLSSRSATTEQFADALHRFCAEMHNVGAAGLLFRRPGALERIDWNTLADALRQTDLTSADVLTWLMPADPVEEPSVTYLSGPGQWLFADELAARTGLVEPHLEFPDAPAHAAPPATDDELEARSPHEPDDFDDDATHAWHDTDSGFERHREHTRLRAATEAHTSTAAERSRDT